MPNKIVFEIDNNDDTHAVAKFYRYMDALHATMRLHSPMVQLIGAYKGKLAKSYMIDERDRKHIESCIQGQESLLILPEDESAPAYLEYMDGMIVELGPKRIITAVEALQLEGWTYDPSTDIYYTC